MLHTYTVFDTLSTWSPRGAPRKSPGPSLRLNHHELGHHGEECSFDAIVKKYNVKDEAIGRLALIVRGADTPRRDLTPESPGLEAIAEGFKRLAAAEGYDDHETIRRERHVYDALYLYCGGDPKKLRRD
jgi:hypothetical protein